MGDWNIAPRDEDVWNMSVFAGSTHVSAPERTAFAAFEEAGYHELTRELTPGAFTYWDYQRLAFPKNRGMRIDLALGSPALRRRVRAVSIDRQERKGKGPSDHVPVVLDLG
jgi:exodeoxyribonuclease-3